ncbi:MAG: acyl-CoA dehydratase activase [Chitinispirillia bacterium]|nr:acyl-CoA dehydratase activase [Chitinispirillia bacterium]MCL2241591.1 acyl-CoA dehydratase activase [Chitinispirillia bacterium]
MSTSAIGICFGSSAIKMAEIVSDGGSMRLGRVESISHESNPRKAFEELIAGLDTNRCSFGMLTGRKFRGLVNAPSITEPECVEYALRFLSDNGLYDLPARKPGAVASLGSENFIVYALDEDGMISTVETGNKCASGTGEFFLQQIRRMNVSVREAVGLAAESEEFKVSGRCSVFCKSDCTHALNKNIPIGRVSAGLCRMMAEKILDLLEKVPNKKIIAAGGVTHNSVIMGMLKEHTEDLYIPEFADCFEAVGAAYYALINKTPLGIDKKQLMKDGGTSFTLLPPIEMGKPLVRFEEIRAQQAKEGDELILGLDVGSTTTKAVALRTMDNAIVASIYLRTNGNPVAASRECYAEILKQITVPVNIIGLGTTGSGRQIAGLHGGTDGVINEIIAHATAAAFFDKGVDTIFEIGGQDAKYTFLTNSVASDYAMNEACSAGTGSFLEESAGETLGIKYTEIEGIAIKSKRPPNFNDQCAAFISSDIRTASHEGVAKEDIVAGLVYSVCMNYVNRVKGQRPAGNKIFMQGGVCYNKAVPLAMANLIGKEIIVPPEPGLMGAFGVALEVKDRIEKKLMEASPFDLRTLADREVHYGKRFVCAGGPEHCDRKCEINTMIIDDKKFPFGGACNKYYNLIHHVQFEKGEYDGAAIRQRMVFNDFAAVAGSDAVDVGRIDPSKGKKTVGINRAFLTNTFYPLYSTFFTSLGLEIVMSPSVSVDGMKRKRSSFCYPAEIAHGALHSLLGANPDFVFLPKVVELYVEGMPVRKKEYQCTCLLLQCEPYYLKSAFKDMLATTKLLSPNIDYSKGYESMEGTFIELAKDCGCGADQGRKAFHDALKAQKDFFAALRKRGDEILKKLEEDPDKIGIVLFGRPYNAFADEGNLGIPGKFASRGVEVIPWDMLNYNEEPCSIDMNWAMGQNILRAAKIVKRHPQLFGAYITNFSCGPDSFVVGYFRDVMKDKPSLTLELDSHTADAGVNTRIEAFLDIVARYRTLQRPADKETPFKPATIDYSGPKPMFVASDGTRVPFKDKKVHVLFPSMGKLTSEAFAAIFNGAGMRASAIPVYDNDVLKVGKGHSSCKECLPLILTTGGLLSYLSNHKKDDEYLIYFMPTCGGNCRFTQYNVYIRSLIEKQRIPNTALLSLTNENGYAGLEIGDALNILKGVLVSDIMEDIKNALCVLAKDKDSAMKVFHDEWERIIALLNTGKTSSLYKLLADVAVNLKKIPIKYPLSEAKVISLLGEIFVRRDYFSGQDLIERLERREIIVRRAPMFEWLEYCDWNVKHGIYEADFDWKGSVKFKIQRMLQQRFEKKIKSILAKSGLYTYELTEMDRIIGYGKEFFDTRLTGEAILVAGTFFRDILHTTCGTIQIGPFSCMPTRVVEAVLTAEATVGNKKMLDERITGGSRACGNIRTLPFLSIESDGNPFPAILESRIEAFCLQVERLHEKSRVRDHH